jgi:hypothetical protein
MDPQTTQRYKRLEVEWASRNSERRNRIAAGERATEPTIASHRRPCVLMPLNRSRSRFRQEGRRRVQSDRDLAHLFAWASTSSTE